MFKFWKKPKEEKPLDKAIELRIDQLQLVDDATDEARTKDLERLVQVKEKLEGPKFRIDPNTIITAVASVGGIVLMLNYEKLDVITSKVTSFIPKLRL